MKKKIVLSVIILCSIIQILLAMIGGMFSISWHIVIIPMFLFWLAIILLADLLITK